MVTKSVSPSPWASLRNVVKQPVVAGALLVVYLLIATFILSNLNRRDLWFPLYSTLTFPMLVLAPFLILAAPLRVQIKALLIVVVLFLIIPYLGIRDSSYLELIIQICIFAGLALGLNIVVGFAGLLDLGYIAFFAVGAYTWGMVSSQANTIFYINGWLVSGAAFYGFIFIGVGVAALVGILLGLPVLRLRGDYLV